MPPMSLSNQIAAYPDCAEYWDKALSSIKGIRVEFKSWDEGFQFQARMNQFRSLDREANKRIYKREEPGWGTSAYDGYIVKRPVAGAEGTYWVYIEPHGSNVLSMEELE